MDRLTAKATAGGPVIKLTMSQKAVPRSSQFHRDEREGGVRIILRVVATFSSSAPRTRASTVVRTIGSEPAIRRFSHARPALALTQEPVPRCKRHLGVYAGNFLLLWSEEKLNAKISNPTRLAVSARHLLDGAPSHEQQTDVIVAVE